MTPDALLRLALVILWTAVIGLMLLLAHLERAARPYVYGLLFAPVVHLLFYIYNFLWRWLLFPLPPGFFSDLSAYRSWAITINVLAVLIVAIVVTWTKRPQS